MINMLHKLVIVVLLVFCFACRHGQSEEYRPPRKDKLYRPGMDTFITTTCSSHVEEASSSFYTVGDRTSFMFAVKACASVELILTSFASRYGFSQPGAKEQVLRLGDNNNQMTSLKLPDRAYRTVDTPDLLHCREFRTFWVRWAQNMTEFGRGPLVGEQTILSPDLEPSLRVDVEGVALACTPGQSAIWRVPGNSGEYIASKTVGSEFEYDHIWKAVPKHGDFTFHVKAASDVKILLSEEYGKISPQFIEINIASGSTHKETSLKASTYSAEGDDFALSGDTYTELWISWVKDLIMVGHGPMSTMQTIINEFIVVADQVDVRYLAVTCTDVNGAEWVFEDSLEIQHMFIPEMLTLTDNCEPTKTKSDEGGAAVFAASGTTRYCAIWLELPRSKYFMFSVAGNAAAIAMTQFKLLSRNEDVQIILKNDDSVIKVGDTYKTTNDAADVLDQYEYRDFWVGRPGKELQVGKGHVFGEQIFMKMTLDVNKYRPFEYAGFGYLEGTGDTSWKVEDTFGQSITAYTFGNSGLTQKKQTLWRKTKTRNYLVVRLQSCDEAMIVLANSPQGTGDEAEVFYLEITLTKNSKDIGGMVYDFGTVSPLPRRMLPNYVKLDDLIDCQISRQLWISWPRDTITVGVGPIPGENILFSASHSMPTDIGAVALESKSPDNRADWLIEEDGGDKIIHYISAMENKSNTTWLYLGKDVNWTTFEVLAASDVNIFAAYDIFDAENGVEIAICKDSICESTIKERGSYSNSDPTTDLKLDHYESKKFWITWTLRPGDGRYDIKVGEGDIPTSTVKLILKDGAPRPITALNVYPTFDSQAHFIFQENGAKWGRFQTDGLSESELMLNVDHHQDIVFGVQACKDVSIHLYDAMGSSHDDFTYCIHLGTDNKKSTVTPNYSSNIVVSRDTPDLLSCDEFRTFWMTWYAGQLRVGEGPEIGKHPFLDFQEMRAEDIKALTLGTLKVKALWDIPMETAANYYDQTATPEESGGPNLGGIIAGSVIGGILLIVIIIASLMLYRDGRCDRLTDLFSRDRSGESERMD